MSIATRLAEFALAPLPDTAQAAHDVMRLSLYDWMVCGMAGASEPVAEILRGAAPSGGSCAVFGDGRGFGPAAAAWINGATSHALDYDDTHFAHIGHPSVAVFPAALALCSAPEDLIDAALVGAETSVRVGLWLGRAHYQIGFHQTATAGAFGAAVAASRLLRLSFAETQAALGLAATQAAGLKSQFGTMGKPYHAGLAARTGVEAAMLARAGFDTRGAGLDGPQGFGPTHHGENADMAFDGLGRDWLMEGVSHKFHACCHGLHAMLEALATRDAAATGGIKDVEVATHPRWLTVCNIETPSTGLECKFSFRQTAAMALAGWSTAALDSFGDQALSDARVITLRDKVHVVSDPSLAETASRVTLSTAAGQHVLTHDLAAPMDLEARAARLRRKGQALLSAGVEAALWKATHGSTTPDQADLVRLMASA